MFEMWSNVPTRLPEAPVDARISNQFDERLYVF